MKKSQKVFIVPLLIIIAILVIGGGIYTYNQKQQANLSLHNAPSTPIDQTIGWKTYSDTNAGLKFKYPAEWTYKIVYGADIEDPAFERNATDKEIQFYAPTATSTVLVLDVPRSPMEFINMDIISSSTKTILLNNGVSLEADLVDEVGADYEYCSHFVLFSPSDPNVTDVLFGQNICGNNNIDPTFITIVQSLEFTK